MTDEQTKQILRDLAKAKAVFQQRAILAVMEVDPDSVKDDSDSAAKAEG